MKNKILFGLLTTLVAAFAAMSANAANKLYIEPVTFDSYEPVNVEVNLDLHRDYGVTALQFRMVLPSELEFAIDNGNGIIRDNNRVPENGMIFSFNPANGIVMVNSNMTGAALRGTEGPVMSIPVRAKAGTLSANRTLSIGIADVVMSYPNPNPSGLLDTQIKLDCTGQGAQAYLQATKAWAYFTIGSAVVNPGGDVSLEVAVNNNFPVTNFQCYITLPEGFVLRTPIDKSERFANNTTVNTTVNGTQVTLATFNMSQEPCFSGNDGAIFTLVLQAPDNFIANEVTVKMSDWIFTDAGAQEIFPPSDKATVAATLVNGAVALNRANAEIAALRQSLSDALATIASTCPAVKDQFTGAEIAQSIDALQQSVNEAYANGTLTADYDAVMTPKGGIEAAIAKLVEDAKAAQKAADDEAAAKAARDKALADGNAVVSALENALASALQTIATDCPDVKDNFKGEAIAADIKAIKDALRTAYDNKTIVEDYNNILSPKAGIEAAIAKLVADAKEAQKDADAQKALDKAKADADAKVEVLQKLLADALATIEKDCPDVKDNFKGENIRASITDLKVDILSAYQDKTLATNYNSVMAPAAAIEAAIAKLVDDAKAAQAAYEADKAAEQARQEAYNKAKDVVKALEDALNEALQTIATDCPDVKNNFNGNDIAKEIADMKAAIEAAYADKTIADKLSDLIAPQTGIEADIAKLVDDAKAAQAAYEADKAAEQARQEAYNNAMDVVRNLEDALNKSLQTIATDCPDVKDNFKGNDIAKEIADMKAAIEAAYADKTIADKYDDLVAPKAEIENAISSLVADAKAAQAAYEAEEARQAANLEAYEKDLAEIDALQAKLDATLDNLHKLYPDLDIEEAAKAIQDAIDAQRDKAEAAYNAVAEEGDYENTVDSQTILNMIDDLLESADIVIVAVDDLGDDIRIFTTDGMQHKSPVRGRVNILVDKTGNFRKVVVK